MDIDFFVQSVLPEGATTARLLFDLAEGTVSATDAARIIDRIAEKRGGCFVPVYTRHHWASAWVTKTGTGCLSCVIVDSALSTQTQRDYISIFRRLGVRVADMRRVVSQVRGSLECGLHVLAMAAVAAIEHRLPRARYPIPVLSLESWRSILEQRMIANEPLRITEWAELIESTPGTELFRDACEKALKRYTHNPYASVTQEAGGTHPIAGDISASSNIQGGSVGPPRSQVHAFVVHEVAQRTAPSSRSDAVEVSSSPGVTQELILETPLFLAELAPFCNEEERKQLQSWFEARKQEEAHATQRRIDINATAVVLRRIPQTLAHLLHDFEKPARERLQREARIRERAPFECYEPGAMLNDTVLDAAVEAVRLASVRTCPRTKWSVLGVKETYHFAATGRAVMKKPPSDNNVAAILFLPHMRHFIVAAHSATTGDIGIWDSIGNKVDSMSSPNDELRIVIGRFAYMMSTWQRPISKRGFSHRCTAQNMNDCGIQAVCNLVRLVCGKTKAEFSRNQIHAAYLIAQEKGGEEARAAFVSNIETMCCDLTEVAAQAANVDLSKRIDIANRAMMPSEVCPTCRKPVQLRAGVECVQCHRFYHAHCMSFYRRTASRICLSCKPAKAGPAPKEKYIPVYPDEPQSCIGVAVAKEQEQAEGKKSAPPKGTPVHPDEPQSCIGVAVAKEQEQAEGEKSAPPKGIPVHPDEPQSRIGVAAAKEQEQAEGKKTSPALGMSNRINKGVAEVESAEMQNGQDREEDGESSDDEPVGADELESLMRSGDHDNEKACLGEHGLPATDQLGSKGSLARGWYVYNTRPPHVHSIAWNSLAASTRSTHIRWIKRIKAMPPDLLSAPFGTAVVELVLRTATQRSWAWTTIAPAFSHVASALANLPLYTNMERPINMHAFPAFEAASKRAQQNARVTAAQSKGNMPLTYDQYDKALQNLKGTRAWLLLQLGWHFAARIGDIRRVQPRNISIDNFSSTDSTDVHASILFVEGKGAAFGGPYSIHSRLPRQVATILLEEVRSQKPDNHLFTVAEQVTLSKEIAKLPGHSLRSIRRGALTYLAQCGVEESHLQLVSGHKRRRTLLEYLGWGAFSSDAIASADHRAEVVRAAKENAAPVGGGAEEGRPTAAGVNDKHPMWMGYLSGYNGVSGRRVREPSPIFSIKPPSSKELGLCDKIDTSNWPLHVKNVGLVRIDALIEAVEAQDLREATARAKSWLVSSKHYGIVWPPIEPRSIPASNFTRTQVDVMLHAQKIKPFDISLPIRCAVKGFAVPQEQKRRLRPVFEPGNNAVIRREELPPLRYQSRLERRCHIAQAKHIMCFDFAAWYDQIPLGSGLEDCFVIRVRDPPVIDGQSVPFFALTREPMGAAHSAHVAQTITWALLDPVIRNANVYVATMIDNVAIAADDPLQFAAAVKCFVRRCDEFNATLNDRESIPADEQGIIELGRRNATAPFTFLGEVYTQGKVANSERNVLKLHGALERIRQAAFDNSPTVSRRNIAAIISLMTWMANTLGIRISSCFELIRAHSVAASRAASTGWDAPMRITAALSATLFRFAQPLLENAPVSPVAAEIPSFDVNAYDAIIICDACETGFGAFVWVNGAVHEVCGGWRCTIPHSAWSEPLGAIELIKWVRRMSSKGQKAHIAIVTDHTPMVLAQRRPVSGNAAFSKAFHLNGFLECLYGGDPRAQIFYCPGEQNPADAPSRSNLIGDPLRHRVRTDVVFPSLRTFHHPFPSAVSRQWWNV